MHSSIKSHLKASPRTTLSLVCAALLSTSALLCGCDGEKTPLDVSFNSADAGSADGAAGGSLGGSPQGAGAGTMGGGAASPSAGTTGAGATPFDAGALPVATDAATGADTGISPRDAASDASVVPTATGDAAGADASGGDGGTLPPRADLGQGDGKDVLMIGDSWMSLGSANSGIQGGVLKASMRPYRAEGIGGTTLLGGGVIDLISSNIPTQYQQAIRADPDVKTVIMTAGGNDILQTGLQEDCEMMGDACGAQVTKVLDALSMLWAKMAADGVQDIVYILYATPEGKSVDFLLPTGDGAAKRCAAVPAPARCHLVETVAIVMGDIPDGIHPSQVASDRIGKAVVDLMAARGMRR